MWLTVRRFGPLLMFPQMVPLDPDWTTTSCTNSATSQRCCWTVPGVPKRTPPATGSPAMLTSTWFGGIPAAKTTSWFSWRYSTPHWEDMMSLPPANMRESDLQSPKYSSVHFSLCQLDLGCEAGASCPSSGEEQHPSWLHNSGYFGKNEPCGPDQTFFVAS